MSAVFVLCQSCPKNFEQDILSGQYNEAILSFRLCLEFLSGRDFHPCSEYHRELAQWHLVLGLVSLGGAEC